MSMSENEAIKKCDKLINGYSVNYSVSDAFSENGEPYPTFRVMAEFAETCKKALEEIQEYRTIGTLEELQALKEKSVAKKQGNINDKKSHLRLDNAGFLCCGVTGKSIRYPLISIRDLECCPSCGQKLDWSE